MGLTIKSVNINGNERQFMESFVSELTSADSRIVCETEITEDLYSVGYPEIEFTLNGTYTLRLKRNVVVVNPGNTYAMTVEINGISYDLGNYAFSNSAYTSGAIVTRSFNFAVFSADDFLELWFGNYDALTLPNNYNYNIALLTGSDTNLISYSSSPSASALKAPFYDSAGKVYTMHSRFEYAVERNKIELVKNKALLSGGTRVLSLESLVDCSSITPFSTVTVDSKSYYALDENTLIGGD